MLTFLLAVGIGLGSWSCSASLEPASPSDTVTAFTHVNVVPMDEERILENQTVLIRAGVIVEVGSSSDVEVPPGARRIEGAGHYLMPGLVDAHVHLRSTDEFLSYFAHGVTTVVHLSGATSEAPDLLDYRAEIARGERAGPTLYATGPMLDGDPPIFGGVSTVVTTPEAARRAVAAQHEAGYDAVKVYNNLAPDVLVAAAEAAHERRMVVFGHVPRRGGRDEALQRALAAGLDVIAHAEEYFFTYFHAEVDSLLEQGAIPYPDERRLPEVVRMTKEAGTAVIPNLSFVAMTRRQLDDFDGVLANPEARYLTPDVRQMWEAQNPTRGEDLKRFERRERAKYPFVQRLTKALSDVGVPLLLGTDASAPGMYPGVAAHLELRELVAAGLTPYEALVAGTRQAGAFIAERVQGGAPFGVVAPGQRADLLLVRGNPLEDIEHVAEIEGVMARGRWWTRAELDRLREAAAAAYGP